MRIAIQQPYYFPYAGYFELVKSVDLFLFYDSVQYIRRGWVNRNRLRCQNERGWQYITIPIEQAHQTTTIDRVFSKGHKWIDAHMTVLTHTFGKKFLDHPLREVFEGFRAQKWHYISGYASKSVRDTARYLGLYTKFKVSSTWHDKNLRGQDQIIHLCKTLGADTYVNLPGGMHLYDPQVFEKNGIKLEILEPTKHENKLSILDLCIGDGLTCL